MINKGRKSSFTGPIKGEKHYNNKLSYEDVEVIRHLYDNKHRFKVTQQEIADIFCISKSQVSKIINKESWVYQNN
jgi:DNA invertase Pin-like site-specific DNA recombinase